MKEVIQAVYELSDLYQKGLPFDKDHLKDWISNCLNVLHRIPEEDQSKHISELNLDRDKIPMERAQGLQWCLESDTFNLHMPSKEKTHTRQGILSIVSLVYDPLGYLAAVTLPAKHIVQDLCRQNITGMMKYQKP